MKKTSILFVLMCTLAYANPYAKCAGCHGSKGEKAALNGKSKVLKDMTKAEIKSAMLGYQNGTYGGAMKSLMVAQSKLLSESDIDTISQMIGK